MTTNAELNKQISRRADEELFNRGHLAIADELFADDFVYYDASDTAAFHGRAGVKQFATMFRTAFPDLQLTIEEQVAEGDKVAYRWVARGTHRGELMGLPPTGRAVTVHGIAIARLAQGRIVEIREHYDALGLMQQLSPAA